MAKIVDSTSATIATLVAAKALDKRKCHLSRGFSELVSQFLLALYRVDPGLVQAIAAMAQQPQLAQQYPKDYGLVALSTKVVVVAQKDVQVRQAIRLIVVAVQVELGEIGNLRQLRQQLAGTGR